MTAYKEELQYFIADLWLRLETENKNFIAKIESQQKWIDDLQAKIAEMEAAALSKQKGVLFEPEDDCQLWKCNGCGYELVGVDDGDETTLTDRPNFCPTCGGEITYVFKIKK